MKGFVRRFYENVDGATAIEYGLIATLLAVAIIVALTSLGHGLSAKFNGVAASLNSAGR